MYNISLLGRWQAIATWIPEKLKFEELNELVEEKLTDAKVLYKAQRLLN